MKRLLRFWADIDAPIDRATYVRHGVGLVAAMYWRSMQRNSLWSFGVPDPWLLPALGVWTLPFVWLGVTLTLRRARDAGHSCWWSFLFFVPYINYALMAVLAVAARAHAV